jgi:methylthioribose-1-phosphate isomerase
VQHPRSTLWWSSQRDVFILDQTRLPFSIDTVPLCSAEDAARAIETMQVRGAPLIGITAAFGLALQARHQADDASLQRAAETLAHTRPTAINLRWALARVMRAVEAVSTEERAERAWQQAVLMHDEEILHCARIGEHGGALIADIARNKRSRVHVLTHCNAGWLATLRWGTALAPIYHAHQQGIDVHVWVDETRPRNQGAQLTAWELQQAGVACTIVVDNAGGHLMQHGEVDLVIVGSDRTTRTGDVCNKIGTYLKALAAKDNDVPFYAALPSSTIDWSLCDGVREIPIEERDANEVHFVAGEHGPARVTPIDSIAANYAFDVTPARLVTGIITERGVHAATEHSLALAYPEFAHG